jgi:adenylate cyclase
LKIKPIDLMKYSIAKKIFTLALGILMITVVVAVITNIEVVQIAKEDKFISKNIIPIANEATGLNESGLRRRIAFERLYREYAEAVPDQQMIAEGEANFELFTKKVLDHISDLKALLSIMPDDSEEQGLYASSRELVGKIESAFDQQTQIARVILEKRKAGRGDEVKELMKINVDAQARLQEYREKLQDLSIQLAELSATEVEERQFGVLWTSFAVTLLAILLGVVVARMISRNIARPVKELLRATRAVQNGDLSGHAGKLPEDEIGQLGDSFNSMVDELRRKQELQKTIGFYIDPRIVEKVIIPNRPEDVMGQKRIMTVLFTDMANFTTISENLTPSGLVNVINRYLTMMTECVQAEGGIVDKFIGDAVMAYWGPPFVPEKEQAAAACRSALRQLEALDRFRAELPDLMGLRKNLPEIDIRIGLATGEVVVGNIGSDLARSYTVIGDVVNLASRLESANKYYGTRILMSEETMRLAERAVEAREIDLLAVKGKTEPVKIFELISIHGRISPEWEIRRDVFDEGFVAYREQDWPAAESAFNKLAQNYSDQPAIAFLERIKELKDNPPGPKWDGVWRMTTK